jgi:hypothetical protein
VRGGRGKGPQRGGREHGMTARDGVCLMCADPWCVQETLVKRVMDFLETPSGAAGKVRRQGAMTRDDERGGRIPSLLGSRGPLA